MVTYFQINILNHFKLRHPWKTPRNAYSESWKYFLENLITVTTKLEKWFQKIISQATRILEIIIKKFPETLGTVLNEKMKKSLSNFLWLNEVFFFQNYCKTILEDYFLILGKILLKKSWKSFGKNKFFLHWDSGEFY